MKTFFFKLILSFSNLKVSVVLCCLWSKLLRLTYKAFCNGDSQVNFLYCSPPAFTPYLSATMKLSGSSVPYFFYASECLNMGGKPFSHLLYEVLLDCPLFATLAPFRLSIIVLYNNMLIPFDMFVCPTRLAVFQSFGWLAWRPA